MLWGPSSSCVLRFPGLRLEACSCAGSPVSRPRAGLGPATHSVLETTKRRCSLSRGGSGGNALSFDPQLIKPLKTRSEDMSVKDVTEVGEECGLLSGPRIQRPICVHVGTPDPGWISCSCFLLHHHNTTTELQSALLPPTPGGPGNGISAHWVPAEHSQGHQPPGPVGSWQV